MSCMAPFQGLERHDPDIFVNIRASCIIQERKETERPIAYLPSEEGTAPFHRRKGICYLSDSTRKLGRNSSLCSVITIKKV